MKRGTIPLLTSAHQYLLQLPGTNFKHPIRDCLSLQAASLSATPNCGIVTWSHQVHQCIMESQHLINMQHPMQRWLDYSSRWQFNTYQPTVSQVLDLLYSWYELGLKCSVIWTHRSAISTKAEIPGIPKVVSRFLKGIFYLRSPQRK